MDESTQKTCSECRALKPLDDFHRNKARSDGRQSRCKACVKRYDQARQARDRDRRNAQSAAYYAANRERINERYRERRKNDPEWAEVERARSKAYYEGHRAEALENSKRWRKANPERYAEHQRRWRARNPEKVRELSRVRMARLRAEDPEGVRERMRVWSQANRELVQAAKTAWIAANYERYREAANASNRRYRQSNPDKRRDDYHRRRALKAQTSFGSIDLAEIWELQEGRCGICEAQLDRSLRWPDPLSPSIDHIIPLSKGGTHTQDNVSWTCLVCNLRKGASLPD